MANKIQLRRGLKINMPTLSSGEPAYTTDTNELYIGTGSGNVNMSGSQWYCGTAISGTNTATIYTYISCPLVKLGDMYLNTSYGTIYQCMVAGSGTVAKWKYKGTIKGPQGDTPHYFPSNGYSSMDEVTNEVSEIIEEHIAPPTTITIGNFKSKHSVTYCDYFCDGSTDTDVFQQAIDALPDDGGKIVILEGSYNISSQLICDKNVVLVGMGKSTTINCTNHYFIKIRSAKVVIRDIFINVTGNLQTSGGLIYGYNNSDIIIDNCTIDAVTEEIAEYSSDYIFVDGDIRIVNCNISVDIRALNEELECTAIVCGSNTPIIDKCLLTLKCLTNAQGTSGSNGSEFDAYILRGGTISNSTIKCKGAIKSSYKGVANVIGTGNILGCSIVCDTYASIQNYNNASCNSDGRMIGNKIRISEYGAYMGFGMVTGNYFYITSSLGKLYNLAYGSVITSNRFETPLNSIVSVYSCIFSLNKLSSACTVSSSSSSIIESNIVC